MWHLCNNSVVSTLVSNINMASELRRVLGVSWYVVDIFLPLPDGLLANLQASRGLVEQLLQQLPTYHQDEGFRDDNSALGAALQVALKLAVSKQRLSMLAAPYKLRWGYNLCYRNSIVCLATAQLCKMFSNMTYIKIGLGNLAWQVYDRFCLNICHLTIRQTHMFGC